jgi:hypothetical protein
MIDCRNCGEFIYEEEPQCPFCAASGKPLQRRTLFSDVYSLATLCLLANPVILGSCYGTTDVDEDGWTVEEGDCNDNDASTYPGASELCDGVDNNCDGVIDEGCKSTTSTI